MKVLTVAGPPSVGKTAVIVKTIRALDGRAGRVGVVKFDSLSAVDNQIYEKTGIPARVLLAGSLCPDHFFVNNLDDCMAWARDEGLDTLITESAGLCNRCSPHIHGMLGICVVDTLSGVHTPAKIGPMLKRADVVVITKGDIVSQTEREVFAFRVRGANPRAAVLAVDGISGQGASELAGFVAEAPSFETVAGARLRFSMPSAVCVYCIGETAIGPRISLPRRNR